MLDWTDDLPSSWHIRRLDEVASIIDSLHKTPVYAENGYAMVRVKDVSDNYLDLSGTLSVTQEVYEEFTRRYKPQRGDIVFSRVGTYGNASYVSSELRFCLGQNTAVINPQIDGRFLHFFLRSPLAKQQIEGSVVGSTQKTISLKSINALRVPVPPRAELLAISSLLAALDDKIELNRRMNETLEAMARALFRDWFVDFGPTRAKMAGSAPYLSPDLWALFPDRLDDDGKPDGWEAGTLSDLATLNPESWTAKNSPQSIAYVDLANTKWGNIDKTEPYDWKDAPSRAKRILRPGDTIVGTVRPGNGSFTYICEDGLTGSTGFAVLRPSMPRDRAFVWCAATSPANIDRLTHLADGGAYPAVRPEAVASTEIVVPDDKILDAFRSAVTEALSLIEANKTESRTLAQTRNLLLPRLMSGELRVAEFITGEVL